MMASCCFSLYIASCWFSNSSRFIFHRSSSLRRSLEVNEFIERCLLNPYFADFDEIFERLVSLTEISEAGIDSK